MEYIEFGQFGRGYYILNASNDSILMNIETLSDTTIGVYCIDQDTLLIKDPKLATRMKEMEWSKEIKVIESVADTTELINRTTEVFSQSGKSFLSKIIK